MKFLLIEPPFQKFMGFAKGGIPLGLLSLAGSLKEKGHDVTVYDSDYNPEGKSYEFHEKMQHYDFYLRGLKDSGHSIWKKVREVIREEQPEVLGVSMISTKLPSAEIVSQIGKEEGVPITVAGGPHATIKPQEVLNRGQFDYVLTGEGEETFPEIINENKGIVVGKPIKSLDDIPWPSRESLYGLESYQPKDLGMIMTSRGCPNSCNFCCSESLWGRKVRYRSIDNVLSEVDHLKRDIGLNTIYVIDDTFATKRSRVEEFCTGLDGTGINWSCLTRANTLTPDLAQRMKYSGCDLVKLGVESGSERVLKLMNKNIRKADVLSTSAILKDAGIKWVAYIIVGTPRETVEDVKETVQFMKEARPDYISVSNFTPYPGTVFYDQLNSNGEYHLHNHHTAESHGEISRELVLNVAKFADEYNAKSNEREN